MHKRVLVIVSDGCEDIETVAPIDVMTRVGLEVTTASVGDGPVRAAYGNTLVPRGSLAEVSDGEFDGVVLPGGLKNAQTLAGNADVISIVRRYREAGKLVAAICASPGLVLAEAAGILQGRRASSAPGFEERLTTNGATFTDLPVTVDGNIITASGPASALLFGLQIAEYLGAGANAADLAKLWKLTWPLPG